MLIRRRDGELPPGLSGVVDAHLGACDSCRLEYQRLCSALEWVRQQATGTRAPGLAKLRTRLRNLQAIQSRPERRGKQLKHRVTMELGAFLGRQAVQSLLKPVAENGENLLSTIEPVLANFLGDRAAAELASRVVDAAISGA
jgi:hypothetical protein